MAQNCGRAQRLTVSTTPADASNTTQATKMQKRKQDLARKKESLIYILYIKYDKIFYT